jgi:hypothetical protein
MQITCVKISGEIASVALTRFGGMQVNCVICTVTPSGGLPFPEFPLCATIDEEDGEDDIVCWFSAARNIVKIIDGRLSRSSVFDVAEILESLSK